MSNIPVIAAATAAQATQQRVDSAAYVTIMLLAYGLAGVEVATVYVYGGGVWTQVYDRDGNAVTLTATTPQVTLEGGPIYGVTKSATVGAAGVDAVLQVVP